MEYTEEMRADFAARTESFGKEFSEMYTALKEKHLIELVYKPEWIPSPSGVFGVAVSENYGDLKYKPIAAPSGEVIKA